MSRDYLRHRFSLITFGIAVVVLGAMSCQEKRPTATSKTTFDPTAILKFREIGGQEPNVQMLIDEGSPEEAVAYAQHIQDELGIKKEDTLDDVLKACGYGVGVLTGRDAEITPSDQLMARFPGDIVASRFFAPKIIDVSDFGSPAATKQLGWRKVIRLRVKPGSLAEKGITAMFLLFNIFQDRSEVANDPFSPCIQKPNGGKPCSQNNQVMLIVGSPRPGKDSAYWMVFEDAAINGGKRTDNLRATFDGGDVPSGSTTAERNYYIPKACAQCHGGSAVQAKLNYLDSDHWNDRIQDGDDFADLRTKSENGVLFDGKRSVASPVFKAAFDAIKTLNSEIAEQNCSAGGEAFQVRAVENWLRIHATNIDFLPQIDRALPAPATNPGARVWNRGTPTDEPLLRRLNQFCFRCHSSLKYHVFDKEAVFDRKDRIDDYVSSGFMPQDRKLDLAVKQELLKLVDALR